MTTNGFHSEHTRGDEFFEILKSKKAQKTCSTLYNYIKIVAQELSQEQPFYVLDLADVLWKIQLWKENLPNVKPYFAVKANSDPVLIRLFCLLGFSFDCSTKGEISLILENGGKPENIIYAHTVKPQTSLTYASEMGVDFMTFDSEGELHKIKKYFPNAKLLLRLKSENPHCSYDLSLKYGCPLLAAEKLIALAKSLNLNVIGVSFHVGALCEDPSCYTKTICNSRLVFDIARRLGFNFTVLDMGAGFFGSHQREKFFNQVSIEIKSALKQYFSENNVQIIAEPGCFYVGSAQWNVTCVLGKKTIHGYNSAMIGSLNEKESSDIQQHYYVNDGVYGSFFLRNEEYDVAPKPLLKSHDLESRSVYKSKVWGQTCCCVDIVQEGILLPEMEDGEYIVWENTGAYCQNLCSTFTSVPLPVARRVFIKNNRLNLDWIKNYKEIVEYLAENADLIESKEDFP